MNKTAIFLSALFFLFASAARAGELTIAPEKPRQGDTLKLLYKADDRYIELYDLKARIYCFEVDSPAPVGYDVPLEESGATGWRAGAFVIAENTVYGLIKIDGVDSYFDIYDDAGGEFWDFVVFDDEGEPLKNAQLRAAAAHMGNLPANIDKNVDFNAARDYFEKEIKSHPDNIAAKIGLTSLLFDLKRITEDDFKRQMKLCASQDVDLEDETETRAVVRAMKSIGENEVADKLESAFIDKNPKSSLAAEKTLAKLAKAESLDQFSDVASGFLWNFTNSEQRERVFSAVVTAYLQNGKYVELKDYFEKWDDVPPIVYSQMALALVTRDDILPDNSEEEKFEEAMRLYRFALKDAIYDPELNPRDEYKPKYMTESEWNYERRLSRGAIAETMGDIFLTSDMPDSALTLYLKAFELKNIDSPENLYEKIVDLFIRKGEDSLALEYSEAAVTMSKSTKWVAQFNKKTYKKLHPEKFDNYDSYIDSLRKIAKMRRFAKLELEELNIPALSSPFRDIDGRVYDLLDFKGETVVSVFWSSWCGPCEALYPALEKLHVSYRDSGKVKILPINIWEGGDERADALKAFAKESDLDFPIYYDESDMIAQKLGVVGLPSVIVIGQDGAIRFKKLGFTSENAFIEESTDMIEFLSIKK